MSTRAQLACVSKDGRISDSNIKQPDADMRHRPVQTGCRATFQSITSLPTPVPEKGGAVRREDGCGTNVPRLQGAESASSLELWLRSASRRTEAGTFRRGFSEICTALTRWGSPMQLVPYSAPPTRPLGFTCATPAFSAPARVGRPPVAPSLLPEISGNETPSFSGPAFPLRFQLVTQETLPARTGLTNYFAYGFVKAACGAILRDALASLGLLRMRAEVMRGIE